MTCFKAMVNFEEVRTYQPQKKTKDNPDKLPIEESLQAKHHSQSQDN